MSDEVGGGSASDVDSDPLDADAPDDNDGAEQQYTIDQLSSITGITSRTIRFYQSTGVLRHPERVGRVAIYEGDHIDRLRQIMVLQEKGLRLDAIRDVLDQLEEGTPSLQQWLGLDSHLRVPWIDEQPLHLSVEEIADRMGPGREELRDRMIEAELIIVPEDADAPYTITSPALFEISLRLDEEQVDYGLQIDALRIIGHALRPACEQLVQHFADHTGEGFGDDVDQIARQLTALRPLGSDVARILFGQEMERALAIFVANGGVEEITSRQAGGD